VALYQIFNGIKSSIIPENLVLLTRSEQFWKKTAHIRPTKSTGRESEAALVGWLWHASKQSSTLNYFFM